MALPSYNTLATLIGAIAKIEICDWVSNYGINAGNLIDLGLLNDIKVNEDDGELLGEYDNCLYPTDKVRTSKKVKISGALGENDLKSMALVRGKATTDVVVTPMVIDTTDGTAVLGFGNETAVISKKYVRLTVDDISLTPAYSEAATDVYTKLMYEFPRCAVTVKGDQPFKKNGIWQWPFEFEALYDSTVTTSGKVWRIQQVMPHTVTPST